MKDVLFKQEEGRIIYQLSNAWSQQTYHNGPLCIQHIIVVSTPNQFDLAAPTHDIMLTHSVLCPVLQQRSDVVAILLANGSAAFFESYAPIGQSLAATSHPSSNTGLWWRMCASKIQEIMSSGGRLNKKDGLTRYGNSHVQDKTS